MASKQSIRRSRRAFLHICGKTALLALAAQRVPAALAQASRGGTAVKIGIVGSGKLGGAVGSRWVKAGHEVLFA